MVAVAQPTRVTCAGLLALSLGGLSLCLLAATASQLQTVADRTWPLLPGRLELPAGFVMIAMPLLLTAASMLAVRQARAQVSRLGGLAAALVALGLVTLWLMCLVRHDRALTALHASCMMLAIGACLESRRARVQAAAAVLPVLALVSYGAIWGETRCNEPEGMKCLVDRGPRLWVPSLLQRVGVPAFVDLRYADLRGVNWQHRDLRLADLRGAQLGGATLSGSNLRRARLDGIQASDSDWQGVFMNGASMTHSTLQRAKLQAVHAFLVDMRGTDLSQSDLRGASLSHTRLDGVVFGSAQMQGTYLRFSTGLNRQQLQKVASDGATLWPDDLGALAVRP